MTDEVTLPTVLNTGNNSLAGGAGFIGGLVLGSLWNGGGFGFGGNRGGAVADATLANAVEHVSDQVTQGNLSNLQTASSQNQFLGNMINSAGDAIVGAVNSGTMNAMQNTQQISSQLCGINNNITVQGYENRLNAQQLASQMQQNCCQLSREVFEQGCQTRELIRQTYTSSLESQLADAKAQSAALAAQINLANTLASSQQSQTATLIAALRSTTGGTAAA